MVKAIINKNSQNIRIASLILLSYLVGNFSSGRFILRLKLVFFINTPILRQRRNKIICNYLFKRSLNLCTRYITDVNRSVITETIITQRFLQ